MGIIPDLHLTGNRFSNVATFLFVGLLCFEIPNGTSSSRIAAPYPLVMLCFIL
jgi:hypothetical protein